MLDPITLKSGATLQVSMASLSAGKHLMKVVARELSGVSFDFDLTQIGDVGTKDVNTLKTAAFQLLQSDALEAALNECLKVCLYNGERIVAATFEPENARADYLPVAWEVMKVNLRPFFSGLASSLSASAKPTSSDPK